jgi:hypothetical protein
LGIKIKEDSHIEVGERHKREKPFHGSQFDKGLAEEGKYHA